MVCEISNMGVFKIFTLFNKKLIFLLLDKSKRLFDLFIIYIVAIKTLVEMKMYVKVI